MRIKILIATASMALLLAATVAAQPGGKPRGPHGGGIWERLSVELDADADGQITPEEFDQTAFAHLDRDADGVLTAADFEGRGMRGPRMRQRGAGGPGPGGPHGFAGAMLAFHADGDDDGAVTDAEWQALVDQLDADGDGEIDAAEFHAVVPGPPEREPRPEHFEMLAQRLDRDGDGVLESDDFLAVFAELDADDSGVIEAEELPRRRHRRGR